MSATSHSKYNGNSNLRGQRGAVFIVMLVIMVMGAATILVSSFSKATLQIERDKKTAEVLAQARDALIGFATSVNLFSGSARPGDLPCPDTDNDGIAGNTGPLVLTCNLQSQRIGRLPWKTLGLPDLRDGSGERLWYAVSTNFKNSTRTTCTSPGQSGCLNSDTAGTISVFAPDGTQINDGGGSTGVAAVIIAPGDVLQQQNGFQQNRSGAGMNTASNYLDIAAVGGNMEDNASFSDGSSSNGFIQGRIMDSNGNTIVNDQLLVVTQYSIMQSVQKRVAAEVRLCLEDYAINNSGRYPWAAPLNHLSSPYQDQGSTYFGRIPDSLDKTWDDSDTGWTHLMDDHWGTCNTHTSNTPRAWWINWKEMVFYGLARSFRPRDTTSIPSFPSTCDTSGRCLNINDASTPARFVVIVAGREFTSNPDQTQRSSHKDNAFYYLEGGNENADSNPPSDVSNIFFTQSSPPASFNDTLVYQ